MDIPRTGRSDAIITAPVPRTACTAQVAGRLALGVDAPGCSTVEVDELGRGGVPSDGLDADGQLLRTLDECLRRYERDDAVAVTDAVTDDAVAVTAAPSATVTAAPLVAACLLALVQPSLSPRDAARLVGSLRRLSQRQV